VQDKAAAFCFLFRYISRGLSGTSVYLKNNFVRLIFDIVYTMAHINGYSYDIIQVDELRLLKFLDDNDHTSAVLETFSLKQPLPKYHALSYTWALANNSVTTPWAIHMKKQWLPVLESLRSFVKALKDKNILSDGTWWWIDSICIDQANLEERARHVQDMQQIYRQADQVIVWLGAESNDSDLAIDFIKFLDEIFPRNLGVWELRMMLQKDQYRTKWAAFKNFLTRKWWSRIWTIQEFVIPTKLSFWCGSQDVGRTAVCHSLSVADRCPSMGIRETLAFIHAFNRKRAWNLYEAGKNPRVNLSLSLVALGAYFCCMDATNDRDRLYGLMALSTDASLLDVSYYLSSEEVYLRFAQAFIARYKSLDIICFASIYKASSGSSRPSWVPNWQKREGALVIPLIVSQSSKSKIGNIRTPAALEYDKSVYYAASGNREAVYVFQGSKLLVDGIIIDEVDGIAGCEDFEMIQSTEWSCSRLLDGSDLRYSPTEILTSVCKSLALDRKDRHLRYTMPIAEFLRDFLCLCKAIIDETSDQSTPKELRKWFEWTRALCIHGHTFENILRDSFQADHDLKGTQNQDEYFHDTFFGRFFDIVVRLSLRSMTTRNGRIGMVPQGARKGDIICILFGCSVPVLLRRVKYEDSYQLIGECFLDGCMDGSGLDQNELLERTFCIQ
jgi:hypothetical protein